MLSVLIANRKLSGRESEVKTVGNLPHVELVLKRYGKTASIVIADLKKKLKSLCGKNEERKQSQSSNQK